MYTNWAQGQPDPDHALPEVRNKITDQYSLFLFQIISNFKDCIFKSNDPEHKGWYDSDCGRVSVWGQDLYALCEAPNMMKK